MCPVHGIGQEDVGTCADVREIEYPHRAVIGLIANAIRAVEALEISKAEKEAIFCGNAKRLLRL